MDASRWARVQSIFDTASELDPTARAAYLDTACGGDAELRSGVESILATLGQETDYIGGSIRGAVVLTG